MIPRLTRSVRQVTAAWCAVLAMLEATTLGFALSWLTWTEHLGWMTLWTVRTVGYSLAARWLAQDDRRGVWLAICLLAAAPLLYLLPFVDHAENQFHRRGLSALCCALLAGSEVIQRWTSRSP
jgi:hypothetical protein